MRIWDINAGYLNRQSLLGEHRELHGIVSIIVNGKKGYAKHPETMRWIGYGWALRIRHRQLTCEMALRGYTDKSPVRTRSNPNVWPQTYIDTPNVQFKLLKTKYARKEPGRIPLPRTVQELWSQHKYSILARDPVLYKKFGQLVSLSKIDFDTLANLLTEMLRLVPPQGGIRNSIQHMWGHVSESYHAENSEIDGWSLRRLLTETQKRAIVLKEPYITRSTSLSELMVWI